MIYKMDNRKIKKAIGDFNKGVYGKSILLACYTPFLFGFMLTLVSLIMFYKYCYMFCIVILIGVVLYTLIAFCIGTYSYYRELRVFINNKK